MMLQNHSLVKDTFKVKSRPMDFNVTVRNGFRFYIATTCSETTPQGLLCYQRKVTAVT